MEDNTRGSTNPSTSGEDTKTAPLSNSTPATSEPPSSLFIDSPQSTVVNSDSNSNSNSNSNKNSGVSSIYLAGYAKRISQYLSLKSFRRTSAAAVGKVNNKINNNFGGGIWAPIDMIDVIIAILLALSIVLGFLVYWTYYCRSDVNNAGAGGRRTCEHSVVIVTAPLRSWISTYENAGLAFVQQWSGILDDNGECDCRDLGGRLTRGEID